MTARYMVLFFLSMILLVGSLVGYGLYVNISSNAHVEKLAAAQFMRVTGAKVAYREIVPVVNVSTLYLQSAWMLDVHVKLDGTITKLYVAPGDQVKAGQLLGEIVSDELPSQVLQADGKVNEAKANLVKYENTLARYQNLVTVGGVSKQQLDEAVANQAAGVAQVMSAQAYRDQLASRLTGQVITAPRDGDILKVYSKEGTFIRTGESMVMIGDFSVLLARENLRHEVLEKLLPLDSRFQMLLPDDQPVSKAYASNFRRENPGGRRSFPIKLNKVEPPLEVPARYRSVVWEVDNAGGELEPGTYYQVKIYGAEKQRLLTLPRQAVNGESDWWVYLVTPDNRLTERRIRIGVQDDQYVEVLSGLQEGDTVVLSGREGLFPGQKVQVTEAGPEWTER